MSVTMKKYRLETLGMLGQMYDESEEEANFKTGTQFYLADKADAEIALLRAALKVARQTIIECGHAQECGPSWYTHGESGLYQQVRMWINRGAEAVSNALGPHDENGVFLKEKPASEPPPSSGE